MSGGAGTPAQALDTAVSIGSGKKAERFGKRISNNFERLLLSSHTNVPNLCHQ